MEVLRRERPGPQPLAKRRVAGMAREAPAQNPQRPLHAPTQLAERAGALLLGLAGPLLQPAGLGSLALARHEPRGVHDEPQQHEVRVDLAGEHRFEVELQVRLARQRLVVPQDAQPHAVRDDRPQVGVAAVEELLHEPVRVGGGRAALSRRAAIEREAAADEMHRHRSEEPSDGVGAPADLGTGGRGQEAEPQLAQQRQAPLVVGEAGGGLALVQVRGGGAELAVVPAQAIPGVSDYFVQALARGEAVVFGASAGEGGMAVEEAAQEVRREEAAFGADGLEFLAGAGHVTPTSAAGCRRPAGPPEARARWRRGPSPARRLAPARAPRAGPRPAPARRVPARPGASPDRAA